MYSLSKGECEHCNRTFHYLLLNATFGNFFYAYCDSCGTLATVSEDSEALARLPILTPPRRVIDSKWETLLCRCNCGGHFRARSAPRCIHCNSVLSPEAAATFIERNSTERMRGWRWSGSWSEEYCIALEDPQSPGTLRQMVDPVPVPEP
jgi:phage FluMu protein Com